MSIAAPAPRMTTESQPITAINNPFTTNFNPIYRAEATDLAQTTEAKFSPISKSDDPNLQKIIEYYNADGKSNTAVISKDGNSLVVALNGNDAAKKLFSNSWLKNLWCKLTRSPNPSQGLEWYKKYYDPKTNPELEYKSDEPKRLLSSLKKGYYHAQVLFKRNPTTGIFDIKSPNFISISDSYWYAAQHCKLGELTNATKEQRQRVQQQYRHYYTIDKTVANPADPDLMGNTALIAEAFFTALPKSNGLIVPFSLKNNLAGVHSSQLNWRFPLFDKNDNWQMQTGQVSFLKPASRANQDISPVIAELDMQTRISSGIDMNTGHDKHKQLIDDCINHNRNALSALT